MNGLSLDIQATQSVAYAERGIARFVTEHARALLHLGAVSHLGLNPSLPFPAGLHPELQAAPGLGWTTAGTFRARPDAHIVMSPIELVVPTDTVIPPAATRHGVPLAAVLHDVIPLLEPDRYLRDRRTREAYLARIDSLRTFDLVLCNSMHTRRDAIEHLGVDPSRAVFIGAGVSPFFRPAGDAEVDNSLAAEIRKPFVLCVGGGDERKNLDGLLRGWACVERSVRDAHQLVIVCRLDADHLSSLGAIAEREGLGEKDVVWAGMVDDDELRGLYRRAALFVLPSRSEGFGLPAAEALECGCPVVTSDATALPEVLEWPAATFPADDADAMAGCLTLALDDAEFRAELVRRCEARRGVFRWDDVARRTVDAVAGLGVQPGARSPKPRPRIAFVTPLPPTPSGVASYSGRVLEHLADLADVTVYDPMFVPSPPSDDLGYQRAPVAALGTLDSPTAFDAVIEVLGNSAHHHLTYAAALEVPGTLWLHDVRLSGLLLSYALERTKTPEPFMRHALETQYGDRLAPAVREHWGDRRVLERHGVGLTAALLHKAGRVIVNSSLAARLLQLDQEPGAELPPMTVVPHAFPALVRPRGVEPDDPPLVVSLGLVDLVKAPELVLRAFAELRRTRLCRLALVGEVLGSVKDRLDGWIDALGIAGDVIVTGPVNDAAYEAWLWRASAGLQLRTTSNGESSGPIHELVAAGVPVVTNVPTAAELPVGAVTMVGPDAGAGEIASALGRAIDERASTAAHLRDVAAAHTYADVARAVLDTALR